jgi:hypothetical protein
MACCSDIPSHWQHLLVQKSLSNHQLSPPSQLT